jgi:uncharacterized protein (DUF2147 family)
MKRIRGKLTYANVVATIALFLAVGGASAMAASQLAKNSVGAKQLKSNAVTAAKIKTGAVTSTKVAAGAIGAAQLANGAVGTSALANGAVTGGKLADGAVTTTKLLDGSVTGGKLAAGSVGNDKLGDGSVTASKIPDGSITENKLADHYLNASTVGVPLAGANVSSSGTVLRWFNRFGGKPTVEHTSTGFYVLSFPGLEEQGGVSSSIATATLIGNAGEISRNSTGNNPAVETYDSAGVPTNEQFEFALIAATG